MSQSAGKLDYKKTLFLGFGFLASSLAWSIYNSLVPVLLEQRFMLSTVVIGTIMTIDNIFGIIFQPLVGAASDRTFTRYGRRMPWIIIGIPLSAIFFTLIPWAQSLGLMMAFIICFNLIMSMWRSPVIALMPDLTPRQLRSKANGVINLMGGIGSIIAFLIGGILASLDSTGRLTFGMGSIVMVLALIFLVIFIREPVADAWMRAQREQVGKRLSAQEFSKSLAEEEFSDIKDKGGLDRKLTSGEKKSLILLLGAIFFWFCAYNAIETFFTLFATNVLNVSTGVATIMLTSFSLTFVAFALPAGLIAGKRGRKKTIVSGLFLLIAFMLPMIFINPILTVLGVDVASASSLLIKQIVVIGLLACAGFGWACVNINSLPMVVELASHDKIGRFTGYYYFFSFGASIFSPILFGAIRDLTQDYNTLFIYAVICFGLALLCTLFVKHGEVEPHDPEVMEEALLDA